jgi:hypothetical protein
MDDTARQSFFYDSTQLFRNPRCDLEMFTKRYGIVCDQDNFEKFKAAIYMTSLRVQKAAVGVSDFDAFVKRLRGEGFTISVPPVSENGSRLNDFERFYLDHVYQQPRPENDEQGSHVVMMNREQLKNFAIDLMEKFFSRIRTEQDFRIIYGFEVDYENYKKLSTACVYYFVSYRKNESNTDSYIQFLRDRNFRICGDIDNPVSETANGLRDFQAFYRTLLSS